MSDAPATTPTDTPAPAIPDWLDQQFVVTDERGVFDLAASAQKQSNSYKELQRQFTLGRQNPTPQDSPPKDSPPQDSPPQDRAQPTDTAVSRAEAAFLEHGTLTDQHYADLQKEMGVTREQVDLYIAGAQARVGEYNAALHSAAGGTEKYTEVLTWAADNLTDPEIDAFDAVIESGNVEQAKLAVQGLMVRHNAAMGTTPSYVNSGGADSAGVVGYRSNAEMMKAMSDPRYRVDAAYRADVARKVAVTPSDLP